MLSSLTRTFAVAPLLRPACATWQLVERGFAARKGTRIKRQMENRKRARARAEAAKLAPPKKWIPPSIRMKLDASALKIGYRRSLDDDKLPLPLDDVYFTEKFYPISYELPEIIQFHRETHSKTMLDTEDALLEAIVELDLRTKKKTKFVETFEGLIDYKNPIGINARRSVLAICKKKEDQEAALEAGATIVGGVELVKELQKGKIKPDSDFDHLVIHSDNLLDLAPVRGILKKHFPTKTKGNFGTDMKTLVKKFLTGVEYVLRKDDYDPSFGTCNFPFARLNMEDESISQNLELALNHIELSKPSKSEYPFIFRVFIKTRCEFSKEKLILKHWTVPGLQNIYEDKDQAMLEKLKQATDKKKDEMTQEFFTKTFNLPDYTRHR